jgi:hypothetical protein
MFKFFRVLTICLVVSLVGFSMYSKKAKRKGSKGKKIGIQKLSTMRKGFTKKKPKPAPKVTSANKSNIKTKGNANTGKSNTPKRTKPPKNIINGEQQQRKISKKKQKLDTEKWDSKDQLGSKTDRKENMPKSAESSDIN